MSPVPLSEIRNVLLPGLSATFIRKVPGLMDVVYNLHLAQWKSVYVPVKPHIWVPKLTLPEAVAAGAAAAIITNPVITRRFWTGWVK